MGNQELLAIKLALEEWGHWLEGAVILFIVLTNHKNLEYLQAAKHLNPRQARWAFFFTRFQFTVSYIPVTKNGKADALSHVHHRNEEATTQEIILPQQCLVSAVSWDSDNKLRNTRPYHIPSECPPKLTYVLPRLRGKLITWAHSSPGH